MNKTDRLQRTILWLVTNPDTGRVKVESFRWKDCEPAKGDFYFETIENAISLAEQAGKCFFLHIEPEIPDWSENLVEDYNTFLRKLADLCSNKSAVYSIDVTVPEKMKESDLRMVCDTYIREFPQMYKMVKLEWEDIITYMCTCPTMGMILNSDMAAVDIGTGIAKLGLSKIWEHAPIRLEGKSLSKDMLKNAVRWHVSAIDTKEDSEDIEFAPMGFRPEVRHCYSVDEVRNGEKLPFSVWVVNSGNAQGYLDASYHIRLMRVDGDDGLVWDTGIKGRDCYPGEDVFIRTQIPIKNLPAAEYDIQIGLFDHRTGYPVSMGIEGRISDGFYMTFLKLNVCR